MHTKAVERMSNQEIIAAIKNQDSAIERQFYQRHKKQCVEYARKHFFWKSSEGGSVKCEVEDAEELYNDACVLFIQNVLRERIQNLEAKISTYLITSMRYTWMNKARGMKAKLSVPKPITTDSNKESMRLHVRKAISQLDQKCREMMTYRYILGWEDYNDIARATGKQNGDVVRNLISRCRKRFRENYTQIVKLSEA